MNCEAQTVSRQDVVNAVRECGRFIMETADNITPKDIGNLAADKTMIIKATLNYESAPQITVEQRYVCREALLLLHGITSKKS